MKIKTYYIFLILLSLILSNCSEDKEGYNESFINITQQTINLPREASVKGVNVETNLTNLNVAVDAEGSGWCKAKYMNDQLVISASKNSFSLMRRAIVTIEADGVSRELVVNQEGESYKGVDIVDDVKIAIASATATSTQSGESVEQSFDGDMNTLYHSKYGSNDLPIELTYNLSKPSALDYMVYHPRSVGENGIFQEIEIWTKSTTDANFVKLEATDLGGNVGAKAIFFAQTITDVQNVKIIVKSGVGNYASCAEMEFYQRASNFNYLSIFTDRSCSELKTGITQTDINNINVRLYQLLAQSLLDKKYESEFRVQSYSPYQNPSVMAKANKTVEYSIRDNPTGIYLAPGEELIYFADNIKKGANISLDIQNLNKGFNATESCPVLPGPNKYTAKEGGLIYVNYLTATGTEESVKINIISGKVNGYYNSQKHTEGDWARLLNNATYQDFDVQGQYAHLTFPVSYFKKNAMSDGPKLIKKYDDIVYMEQDFMGLVKYEKMFKNRLYLHIDYPYDGWMYATTYRTAYALATMDDVTSLSALSSNPWGAAHEIGHVNQTRPGLKWHGMTEVTNNIHSLYIQTSFGNQSRLLSSDYYGKAYKEIVEGGIAHNASSDVFHKVVPFWQLKLYLIDILDKKDFYKDLYEHYRTHGTPSTSGVTDGVLQLYFVKTVCDVAQLDLTDFFSAWGFLTPVDIDINDYSASKFTVTQAQINAAKAEIASKGYAKPRHNNIPLIKDNNLSSYK